MFFRARRAAGLQRSSMGVVLAGMGSSERDQLGESISGLPTLPGVTFFRCGLAADSPLSASANIRELVGYTQADLTQNGWSLLALVDDEDRPSFQARRVALAADRTGTLDEVSYRLRHADGHVVWVSERAAIQVDDAGQRFLVGQLIDVTEAELAKLELAEKTERLELVIEGTRLGIWDWNPQTNEVAFNERWAEMLGWDLSEIPATVDSWSSRVHPEDIEACYADIQRHMSGELDFYENVHRMRHRDGSWRYILDRGRVMARDDAGQPLRFTGTHTDITAQKQAELAAREAANAKSHFLATMSHEMRTPLHGMLGLLDLIDRDGLTKAQLRFLRLMAESGQSLLVLINDLLDVSKLEQGSMRLESEWFVLRDVISSVEELHGERARHAGLEFHCTVDEAAPQTVLGDAHRFRQILENLVGNALKFTASGSVGIAVTSTPADGEAAKGEVTVAVTDTGCGISNTEQIWERFTQEDASIARQYGGSGLGLSIVKQLAALMGGSVAVKSEVGRGSTFSVTLPFAYGATSVVPDTIEGDVELPQLEILVAEDNPVNQLIVTNMLERCGQRFSVVGSGEDAVTACAAARYDVVLMDLHMPGINGFEATKRIRDHGGHQPRIYALSADRQIEQQDRFAQSGLDGYLTKPFRRADLLRLLSNLRADAA